MERESSILLWGLIARVGWVEARNYAGTDYAGTDYAGTADYAGTGL
ncbi:MAG: hypothetical protein HC877_16605 [Thioploca sp.]|nr:hypothetical protein [Thioploca sp.]